MSSNGMPTNVKIVLCKNNAEIATICAHVLILPSWFAATTSPSPAKIKRKTCHGKLTAK